MVNLLKNKQSDKNLNSLDNSENREEENLREELNKVDIKRYKDPYGLSLGQMRFGLWLISNRRNFLSAFLAFLILISFIFWSIFLYTFGFYIFKGMKDDGNLLSSFSKILIPEETLKNISARNLEFSSVRVFNSGNNKYDFLVKVKNPNKDYFAHFNYSFESNHKKVGFNSSFILPNESKYIMSLGVLKPENFSRSRVKLILDDLEWERIDNKNFPDWDNFSKNRLKIKAQKEGFIAGQSNNLSDKINLNKFIFSAQNLSAYNYWEVGFNIILIDNDQEVGANIYKVNNFMSEDEIKGEIVWPGNLPRFTKILIMPEIDITKDDIYISLDGSGGQTK